MLLLLLSRFSCVWLCDPIDGSQPGSAWDSPGKNTRVGCHFLLQCMKVKSESEVAQSCQTPRDPMDCSLPGSSVHGTLQARVLEWVAIAFSRSLVNIISIKNHSATSVTENVKLPFHCSLYLQSQNIMWCISWWNQKTIFHPVALAGFQSFYMQTFPVHFWTMLDFFLLIIGILLRFLKKTTQTCKRKKKKRLSEFVFFRSFTW